MGMWPSRSKTTSTPKVSLGKLWAWLKCDFYRSDAPPDIKRYCFR